MKEKQSITFDLRSLNDPEFEKRVLHHANRLGMDIERRKKYEITVLSDDPMNFYWLGANIAMQPFDTGISKHV